MGKFCTNCGTELKEGAQFCAGCGTKIGRQSVELVQAQQTVQPQQTQTMPQQPMQQVVQQPQQAQPIPQSGLWYQNYYRIRKKVLTVGNRYWIEDFNGNILGYCKQKLFKLKEDIRIFTDESERQELFSIKQQQIMDAWGSFTVVDSYTGNFLGYIKREVLSSAFGKDTYELFNINNQLIGRITETSTGRALTRKYIPGGALVPEKMTLDLNGVPIAEINQSFKIIGDIWEMICKQVPPDFDRRVLLSTMLLMGTIERDRK